MQTEHAYTPRNQKHKSQWLRWGIISFLLSLFITTAGVGIYFYVENKPNQTQVNLYPEAITIDDHGTLYPLIVNGEMVEGQFVLMNNEEYFISLDVFQHYIDGTVWYDQESNAVIFTANQEVVTLRSEYLTNELKNEQVELKFPVQEVNHALYIPFSPFEDIYPVEFELYPESELVKLQNRNEPVIKGNIYVPDKNKGKGGKKGYIRTEPSIKYPYIQEVTHDDQVVVHRESQHWFYIETKNGWVGYVPNENVKLLGVVFEEEDQNNSVCLDHFSKFSGL